MIRVHYKKRIVYMLVLLIIAAGSALKADAANPSGYVSLHGDYGRAPVEKGNCVLAGVGASGYRSKMRVFVPPGASSLYFAIYEYGNQTAIVRHELPPTTLSIPANYFDTSSRTLAQLTASDQIINENKEGKITIINQGIYPTVSQGQAGWLYAYITGGSSSSFYENVWIVEVDAAIYNDWYDHYGTNQNGSINWDRDIEGVTTYLEPNPLPGKPEINPSTGNWTTSPQNIAITSSNAARIVANVVSTTDGTEPADPALPTGSAYDLTHDGASWSLPVTAINNSGITRYKYRFLGINSYGAGNVSNVCTYTLDLSPYTPDPVTASPASGTTTKTAPLNIAVSSANSTKIYYTYTTDGTTPAAPDAGSGFVAGPSGTISLSGVAGQVTTYKMLFKAFNQNGGLWGDVSSEYTYTLDRRPVPPDPVLVNPTTGSWTSAPQYVTVSSSGATKIYASAVTTTDGSEPADPSEPTTSSAVVVNGAAGDYSVPSNSGKNTRTKVRFRGYNADGYGPTSAIYSYSIDLPNSVPLPGSVAVSPTQGAWTDPNRSISVNSSNATYIYAKMSVTTDNTVPPDPQAPVDGYGAYRVSGSSGSVPVPSNTGKITRVKMIFGGYNSSGFGPTSQVYSYSIDLRSTTPAPGPVSVVPGNTNWTSAGQTVAVSSANASQIEYAYNKTTDGTDPADPGDPSLPSVPGNPFFPAPTTTEIRGTISGGSGNFAVPSTTGAITKIKIKFCGKNATGYGTSTQTYSYSIDLKTPVLPGAVVVTPADTNWTTAPQTISVSSANANQIHYNYTITEDGSEPPSPADPSTATVVAGQISGTISGGSGNFTVPSASNKNTRIKIRFCGKNGVGYGIASIPYSYGINLIKTYKYGDTISQPEAMAAPGLNITSIISTNVGGENILDPNAKFLKNDPTLSYSVVDLVTEYLRALLNDASIQVDSSADGVMIIGSPNFGGFIYTVITGSLVTTADTHYFRTTATGNIVICTRNIIITLYPAGADQALFKKTLENYGWNVSYTNSNVVLVDALDLMMSFRFQFYADRRNLSGAGGEECQFSSANSMGYGTVAVTYPDGTTQILIPFIHDPEAFDAFAKNYGWVIAIDATAGNIMIMDGQGNVNWKGVPEYKLYPPGGVVVNSVLQPMPQTNGDIDWLFITNQAAQVLFENK